MRVDILFILLVLFYSAKSPDHFLYKQIDKIKDKVLSIEVQYETQTLAKAAYVGEYDGSSLDRDAWGMGYKLIRYGNGVVVRSAGPDREFNTADDVISSYGFEKEEQKSRSIASVDDGQLVNDEVKVDPLLSFDRSQEKDFKTRLRARLDLEGEKSSHKPRHFRKKSRILTKY